MDYINLLLLFLVPDFTKCLDSTEDVVIQTNYGKIKGKILISRGSRQFYSFKGIPYAKPPLEDLRFRPPEKPEPWKNTLVTQNDVPPCAQKNYLFANPIVEGKEDCLYLNVYTPKLPKINRQNASKPGVLPVMVFIHWGGFFTGYGGSNYLGPEYFMDKNVILVTFNYRLGILGFFSTSDDEAPGNYGLKDQVMALKWIQENIHHFGGDNHKITIFGQSAGAASVHYHMISPESKGLFQQGISESGAALALWAKPLGPENQQIARMQAAMMGCNGNSTFELVECLRKVDATTLIDSGDNFKAFSIDPLSVYLPAIEKKTENNPNPFITKQPVEYIEAGEFSKIPWIIGVVTDEGLIRAAPLSTQSHTRNLLNSKFDELMPMLIGLHISMPKSAIYNNWNKIKEFYFENCTNIDIKNEKSIKGLVDIYTDRFFQYSVYQSAILHSLKGHRPIWFYSFEYKGKYSYGKIFAATNETIKYDFGVSHCDELLYLFNTSALFPELKNANDVKMSKIMIKLWTNFATYGNPTPSESSITWKALETPLNNTKLVKDIDYLNISGSYKDGNSISLNMEHGFYNNRFKFWEGLSLVENIKELDENHIDV